MTNADSRQDYWRDIKSHAESVIEAVKESGSDVEDAIHEAADSSWWVIYYHAAHMVWKHSDNQDAISDALGNESFEGAEDLGDCLVRMAYYALAQDIRDELERMGFDPEAEGPHTDGRTDGYGSLG